ncbi:MAG: DNA-deoxyinosine glycosylase [Myxococcota bacterium]
MSGASAPRVTGLPPVAAPDAHTLVLGTMPSVASLAAGEYYGHPRNAFWDVVDAIGVERDRPYRERCAALCERGFALWDVLAECVRAGSLDAAIRDPAPNDLARFVRAHRALRRVWFNGQTARRLFERHAAGPLQPLLDERAIALATLPSTSPANTARAKRDVWRAALVDALASAQPPAPARPAGRGSAR